jgi:hypothetical protein
LLCALQFVAAAPISLAVHAPLHPMHARGVRCWVLGRVLTRLRSVPQLRFCGKRGSWRTACMRTCMTSAPTRLPGSPRQGAARARPSPRAGPGCLARRRPLCVSGAPLTRLLMRVRARVTPAQTR